MNTKQQLKIVENLLNESGLTVIELLDYAMSGVHHEFKRMNDDEKLGDLHKLIENASDNIYLDNEPDEVESVSVQKADLKELITMKAIAIEAIVDEPYFSDSVDDLARLYKLYKQTHYCFVNEQTGVAIDIPTMDTTGRFYINPIETYGDEFWQWIKECISLD